MNNFVTRALSGFLFVAVIISSILFNPYVFAGVFALITGLAVREFQQMTTKEDVQVSPIAGMFGGIILFICTFIHASKLTAFPAHAIYGLYVVVIIVAELFRKKSNPLHNWAYFLMGQIYVALPFSLLNLILFINDWQPIILLAVFVTIWVNDTGAYLFGISFGKHRMFERVSPKKSWEGFVGGAFTALISGFIFSRFIQDLSLLEWFIFSEIIVIAGTLGDLIESLMKRTVNIKDSGNVIPGHGGLLDRFDSMLLAAPVTFIYLILVFYTR